jgi:hypothetical protein
MSTILGTGIGSTLSNNVGIYTTTGTGGHPLMNSAQMYPQTQRSIDVGLRIIKADNGFIVEIGNYESGLVTKYIAKDMNEVRDLITSDIVTRRMEGM